MSGGLLLNHKNSRCPQWHQIQNIGHVQHTDAQINRIIIDNINQKHKTDKKHHILTHTQEAKTQGHFKCKIIKLA